MVRSLIGSYTVPICLAIYFVFRRQYAAALGCVIGVILVTPVLLWLDGLKPSPSIYYVSGVTFVVLTALELWYLRVKKRKSGKSHRR